MSRYVDEYRGRSGVEPICRTFGVSVSAYYKRASGRRTARAVADDRLVARIQELHAANHYAYGYRRMWHALQRTGESVGRRRVRLMKSNANPRREAMRRAVAHDEPDPRAAIGV